MSLIKLIFLRIVFNSKVTTEDHQDQPPALGNVMHDSVMWTVSALLAQCES